MRNMTDHYHHHHKRNDNTNSSHDDNDRNNNDDGDVAVLPPCLFGTEVIQSILNHDLQKRDSRTIDDEDDNTNTSSKSNNDDDDTANDDGTTPSLNDNDNDDEIFYYWDDIKGKKSNMMTLPSIVSRWSSLSSSSSKNETQQQQQSTRTTIAPLDKMRELLSCYDILKESIDDNTKNKSLANNNYSKINVDVLLHYEIIVSQWMTRIVIMNNKGDDDEARKQRQRQQQDTFDTTSFFVTKKQQQQERLMKGLSLLITDIISCITTTKKNHKDNDHDDNKRLCLLLRLLIHSLRILPKLIHQYDNNESSSSSSIGSSPTVSSLLRHSFLISMTINPSQTNNTTTLSSPPPPLTPLLFCPFLADELRLNHCVERILPSSLFEDVTKELTIPRHVIFDLSTAVRIDAPFSKAGVLRRLAVELRQVLLSFPMKEAKDDSLRSSTLWTCDHVMSSTIRSYFFNRHHFTKITNDNDNDSSSSSTTNTTPPAVSLPLTYGSLHALSTLLLYPPSPPSSDDSSMIIDNTLPIAYTLMDHYQSHYQSLGASLLLSLLSKQQHFKIPERHFKMMGEIIERCCQSCRDPVGLYLLTMNRSILAKIMTDDDNGTTRGGDHRSNDNATTTPLSLFAERRRIMASSLDIIRRNAHSNNHEIILAVSLGLIPPLPPCGATDTNSHHHRDDPSSSSWSVELLPRVLSAYLPQLTSDNNNSLTVQIRWISLSLLFRFLRGARPVVRYHGGQIMAGLLHGIGNVMSEMVTTEEEVVVGGGGVGLLLQRVAIWVGVWGGEKAMRVLNVVETEVVGSRGRRESRLLGGVVQKIREDIQRKMTCETEESVMVVAGTGKKKGGISHAVAELLV